MDPTGTRYDKPIWHKSANDNNNKQLKVKTHPPACMHLVEERRGKQNLTRKVWQHSSQWLDNFRMLKIAFSISLDITRLVQPIPPHSQENTPKLQIWLVSLSQITTKIKKINRPWPKCKQSKKQSGYISMSNFKPFLPSILMKIARTPKFELFHKVKMMPKWGKSTDHDQNLISSDGGQDTSACQSSGHSSFVFSRKCLEVANLACFTKPKRCQNEQNQQIMTKI